MAVARATFSRSSSTNTPSRITLELPLVTQIPTVVDVLVKKKKKGLLFYNVFCNPERKHITASSVDKTMSILTKLIIITRDMSLQVQGN